MRMAQIIKPLSSSDYSKESISYMSMAADWRFLHSCVVRGKVMRLVWNPSVKPCTRNIASEGLGCVER